MDDKYKVKVKICLLGDAGVGKTSLIRRYVMDMFDDKYITTLGTKVSKRKLVIKKNDNEFDLTFSIWDILGQEEFKNIQNMALKNSKGAIIVCDITRKKTLENIQTWFQRVQDIAGDVPVITIANKSDLKDECSFSEQELKEVCGNLNSPHFMTSAKQGDNVIRTFYKLGEMITSKLFIDNL